MGDNKRGDHVVDFTMLQVTVDVSIVFKLIHPLNSCCSPLQQITLLDYGMFEGKAEPSTPDHTTRTHTHPCYEHNVLT